MKKDNRSRSRADKAATKTRKTNIVDTRTEMLKLVKQLDKQLLDAGEKAVLFNYGSRTEFAYTYKGYEAYLTLDWDRKLRFMGSNSYCVINRTSASKVLESVRMLVDMEIDRVESSNALTLWFSPSNITKIEEDEEV